MKRFCNRFSFPLRSRKVLHASVYRFAGRQWPPLLSFSENLFSEDPSCSLKEMESWKSPESLCRGRLNIAVSAFGVLGKPVCKLLVDVFPCEHVYHSETVYRVQMVSQAGNMWESPPKGVPRLEASVIRRQHSLQCFQPL